MSIVPPEIRLTDEEFEVIQSLAFSSFGIKLADAKRSLVESRLQDLILEKGYKSYQEYLDHLKRDGTNLALSEFVNRISTNHSYFFREQETLDHFNKTLLPERIEALREKGEYDLRIWCAGCATGEEAYTLVILTMEALGSEFLRWKAGLLATDISKKALVAAKEGYFKVDRMDNLSQQQKQKYFTRVDEETYRVREEIRKQVTFRRHNLMNAEYSFKKPFHFVFCRNVMIYFDSATNHALARKFHEIVIPGGYLLIGLSETFRRDKNPFEYIRPATYRKAE